MQTIKYYPDNLAVKYNNLETLYLHDNYNDDITLSDIKMASSNNEIQLFSTMLGNFGYLNIFLGSYYEFIDYIQDKYNDEVENGYLHFTNDSIDLNIKQLKNKITRYIGE